jgi:4-hydroxy-2-oxoheptanedioate aldolase
VRDPVSEWYWQRRANPFKERLDAGEPAFIVGVDIAWTPLAEIVGSAGADAAFIDMEHTTLSLTDVENLIVACDAAGISSLVRSAGLDTRAVAHALDSGAHGIIYPNVRTREEAERGVAATKYPPAGTRPWGGAHSRSVMWEGVLASRALQETDPQKRGIYTAEFVEHANSSVHTTILIESPEGVANLPEIVEVPGIDAVWFGWADYSAHVAFDLTECTAAATAVYELCREAGIGMCLAVDSAESQPWYPGSFYLAGLDTLILSGAIRAAMAGARQRVEDARRQTLDSRGF